MGYIHIHSFWWRTSVHHLKVSILLFSLGSSSVLQSWFPHHEALSLQCLDGSMRSRLPLTVSDLGFCWRWWLQRLWENKNIKKTNTSEVFQYVDFKHLQQQRDGLFDSNSSFSKKTSDRTQEQRNLLHSFLPSHPLINSKVALAQCYKIKVVEIFSFWNMEYIIRMSDSCIWKGVPLHVWMQQWGIDVLHTSPSPFLIRVETFDLMKVSFSNMKLLNHLGFVCFSQLRLSWKSVDSKSLNKLERKELLPFKIVYFYWSGNISEIENKYWF